jgi:hypothetical protein
MARDQVRQSSSYLAAGVSAAATRAAAGASDAAAAAGAGAAARAGAAAAAAEKAAEVAVAFLPTSLRNLVSIRKNCRCPKSHKGVKKLLKC